MEWNCYDPLFPEWPNNFAQVTAEHTFHWSCSWPPLRLESLLGLWYYESLPKKKWSLLKTHGCFFHLRIILGVVQPTDLPCAFKLLYSISYYGWATLPLFSYQVTLACFSVFDLADRGTAATSPDASQAQEQVRLSRAPRLCGGWGKECVRCLEYKRCCRISPRVEPPFFPPTMYKICINPHSTITFINLQFSPIWWMKHGIVFYFAFLLLVILSIFSYFIDHLYFFFCELPTHFFAHFSVNFFVTDLQALYYILMLNIY